MPRGLNLSYHPKQQQQKTIHSLHPAGTPPHTSRAEQGSAPHLLLPLPIATCLLFCRRAVTLLHMACDGHVSVNPPCHQQQYPAIPTLTCTRTQPYICRFPDPFTPPVHYYNTTTTTVGPSTHWERLDCDLHRQRPTSGSSRLYCRRSYVSVPPSHPIAPTTFSHRLH